MAARPATAPSNVTLEILRGAREPLPPHVISQRLCVTRGTVTGVLDTLEQHGLVRRLAHPDDRRKLLVEITEPAVRLLDDLLPRLHRLEREWLDCLSPSEQETWCNCWGVSAPASSALPPHQPLPQPPSHRGNEP